jgi:type IV pilus assembly protein PilB
MLLELSRLKEILIKPGYVKEGDFFIALKNSKTSNIDIDIALVNLGFIKDEEIGQLIAQELGLSFINLRNEKIDEKTLKKIPELVSRAKKVIVFAENETSVNVAFVDPYDLELKNFLETKFGKEIKIYLITNNDFLGILKFYKGSLKEEIDNLSKFKDNNLEEGEIVKFVDIIIEHAFLNAASDIHIEPHLNNYIIRFRIDGLMQVMAEIKKEKAELIISRIKILAKMRIDEHQRAQDGKFRYGIEDNNIDIRVSIIPVSEGENIVMRLLTDVSGHLDLDTIGLSPQNYSKIERIIKDPHGLVISSGPTGSGKTTTIYEILKILNTEKVHISSIEDPVEYNIEGVSQIQVNPKVDLTFAKGLRAIVRQDPDIIMVGEIRDVETAKIGINSAMTGHLVLSTMHANDAATTINRLLDMGIEAYLISSTVNAIIAQRLVRRLCEKCRYSYKLSDDELYALKSDKVVRSYFDKKNKKLEDITFYKSKGCKICAGSGYKGRVGVYEVMELSPSIKELIVNHASADEINKKAQEEGMDSILEDGLTKAINGITSIDEVLRVTKT